MRAPVRVVSQAAFATWLREQQSGGGGGNEGAATFTAAGCGGCHAFKPAGTDSEVGPALDDVAADAQKAGRTPPHS